MLTYVNTFLIVLAMPRARHPDKAIEAAVARAERAGWRVTKTRGHGWGQLWCPYEDRDGCKISVWSTPRKPTNHAKGILRALARCPHKPER